MKLIIILKNKKEGSVQLVDKDGLKDEVDFSLDFHFDTVLVTSIDKILKKNRIEKVSPLECSLEGFGDEVGTVYLIAKSAVEALKSK